MYMFNIDKDHLPSYKVTIMYYIISTDTVNVSCDVSFSRTSQTNLIQTLSTKPAAEAIYSNDTGNFST